MRVLEKVIRDDDDRGGSGEAERIVKRAESLEDQIDEMAEQRAARTGESFAKAYVAVLDTEFGRAAYEQICGLRESAARRY